MAPLQDVNNRDLVPIQNMCNAVENALTQKFDANKNEDNIQNQCNIEVAVQVEQKVCRTENALKLKLF